MCVKLTSEAVHIYQLGKVSTGEVTDLAFDLWHESAISNTVYSSLINSVAAIFFEDGGKLMPMAIILKAA